MNTTKGLSIATAVAALLSTTTLAACGEKEEVDPVAVKCSGINECAGQSECASPEGANNCHGLNECAGLGWITVESEDACLEAGGTVIS